MLSRDFKEFIEFLNSNRVEYLLIGGYAVAIHGHPRYTKDLDIWVNRTEENAVRLLRALDEFGFGSSGLTLEDLMRDNSLIQLGVPPNRIDILNAPDGVEFGTCYQSKIEIEIEGVAINVIDLENLILNKTASGRHQDLADVEALEG